MKTFSLSLMTAPFLVILDLLWTGVIAHNFYEMQLGRLLSPTLLIWPLVLFYVLYTVALVHFAVKPGVVSNNYVKTAANAAFLGLVAYATYDLVNLGVTIGWPVALSFVDIGWGVVLSTVAASGGYWLAKKVFTMY